MRLLAVFALAPILALTACRPAATDDVGDGSADPAATDESEPTVAETAEVVTASDGEARAGSGDAPGDEALVLEAGADAVVGTSDARGVVEPSANGAVEAETPQSGSGHETADLSAPVMRMPPGASTAVAVDLAALHTLTSGLPRVSAEAGLDDALGNLLARAVGAPGIADRVRAPETGVLTVGAWGDDGDDITWFAPVDALSTPPADGGAAASIGESARAARRGPHVAVGRGFGVTAFAGDAAGGLDTATIAGAADALRTDGAMLAAWWTADRVDEALPGIGAAVDGIALAVDPDGGIRIALAAADPDSVLRTLGRGQAWLSMAFGQWRRSAPTDASAAVALAARHADLVWSRFTVTPHDGYVAIRMAAPECGGPLSNVPTALAVLGIVEAAAHDEAAPSIAFVPTSVDTASCEGPLGPPPSVPVGLARLAPTESSPGLVVLADMGGIVRHLAPDAGGLLPARIAWDALDAAAGGRPFGLDGLGDTEGHIGAWIEGATGAGAERALVLPRGIADLDVVQNAGPGAVIGDMVLNAVVPGGLLFATRGAPAAARLDEDGDTPWTRAAERLPDDTLAALLVPASLVDPWLTRLPSGDGAAVDAAMRSSEVVSIAWSASQGPALVFGPGVDGAAVRAALPSALATGVASIGRYGALAPDAQADLIGRLDHLAAGMRIDADDTRTLLVFEGGSGALAATVFTVALPAIGGALDHPGLDLQQVSPQLIYDATRNSTP